MNVPRAGPVTGSQAERVCGGRMAGHRRRNRVAFVGALTLLVIAGLSPAAWASSQAFGTLTGTLSATLDTNGELGLGPGYTGPASFSESDVADVRLKLQSFDGHEAVYRGWGTVAWHRSLTAEYTPEAGESSPPCSYDESGSARTNVVEVHYNVTGSDKGAYDLIVSYYGPSGMKTCPIAKYQLGWNAWHSWDEVGFASGRAPLRLAGAARTLDGRWEEWELAGSWKDAGWRDAAKEVVDLANEEKDWCGISGSTAGLTPLKGSVVPVAVGCVLGALVSRELAKWIVKDPPDHNYTQVAQPRKVRPPRFRAGDGLSANQVRAINDYAKNALELESYGNAFMTSYQRAEGVDWSAANAEYWWNRQENATQRDAVAAATCLDKLASLRKRLVQKLGRTAKLRFTDKLIAKTRDDVRRHGLPAAFVKALRTVGVPPNQMREILDAVRQASAGKIPDTVAQLLTDKKLAAGEHQLAVGLRQVAA